MGHGGPTPAGKGKPESLGWKGRGFDLWTSLICGGGVVGAVVLPQPTVCEHICLYCTLIKKKLREQHIVFGTFVFHVTASVGIVFDQVDMTPPF